MPTDYRPTVFLPKTDFPMRGGLPTLEPKLVGKQFGEVQVHDVAELSNVVEEQDVVVGVLAVPSAAAQDVADRLVDAGVKIVFNYSEQLLQVPPDVTVHTSSPAVDLLYALYFYLT